MTVGYSSNRRWLSCIFLDIEPSTRSTSGLNCTYGPFTNVVFQNAELSSLAGTITRGYDLLDRLTSETTPEGTITYTYDAAGRRTAATVSGQAAVSYSYDSANRLTGVTEGTATVSFGHDTAGRRTSLTLPNGPDPIRWTGCVA